MEESDPAQSVPLEASTRKECLERKKLHPRRYSFCNNPPQMSGDRVIIWNFGNLIACTMTMGSKHTSFPNWKSPTPLQVCPWKRPLARSDLREKNSIRGGTHFAIIPFKRPEIRVIIWSFGNLIACRMTMGSKHTSFPKLKSQTPRKVCPWKRPLARSLLREKNYIRGGTHFAIIPLKRPETV